MILVTNHKRLFNTKGIITARSGCDDHVDGFSRDPLGWGDCAFRKATEGYSMHGLLGWLRQADILRPLATILTARVGYIHNPGIWRGERRK